MTAMEIRYEAMFQAIRRVIKWFMNGKWSFMPSPETNILSADSCECP
jgi:hypothetical protein